MKNMKKRLSVILMVMVLLTSFEFIGVFAEDGVNDGTQSTESQATEQTEADNTLAAGEDIPSSGVLVEPEVKAYASFESVKLKWEAVEGAEGYNVYKGSKLYKTVEAEVGKTSYSCTVKKLDPYTTYKFKVEAFTEAFNANDSVMSKVVSKRPVRNMKYKVKIKASGTLQSHGIVSGSGAKKKSYYVRAGQWLEVDRYGAGGKYIFSRNGNIYYCNLTRTSSKKALYAKKFNYTETEAELYVNAKGLSSRTKYLVWISTYTQHVFLFKGSKGNWKVVDDWECSTGKPGSPTPTGITGKKAIWKKIRSRHGIPYWSPFSDINSIHGKKSGWTFGKPYSNGCVRNPNEKAKLVYEKAKIGTTVMVY